MRRSSFHGEHVTGLGVLIGFAAIAAFVAAVALFDDTGWIGRHEAASRAALEAAR